MNEAEMSSSLSIFFFGWIFRLTGRCWTIKKWKRIWKKKKKENGDDATLVSRKINNKKLIFFLLVC